MAKNTNLPTVDTPSLSIPKPTTPRLYHVLPSTPFKMGYTPAERRHVKDLGDIILGNPITGTRQLRETLEDNNAANLIGNPIISRLAGLNYWAKERLIDPFKERSIPEAASVAFVNTLESIGYSLDLLANPVKALMPWAGGGKDGDFLRSMGWIDDEYREQYQWNTGVFAVDLAGEILSDPLNFTKIGDKIVLNLSSLPDELEMTIRNAIRTRWGDVVANNVPSSVIKNIIKELETDVSDLTDSKILAKLTYWVENEDLLNTLTKNATQNSADALRFETRIQEPYKKVLDLDQQKAFLQDLLDIKSSELYRQYRAIRRVGERAEQIDKLITYASLGMNPFIASNFLLFKNLSPIIKQKWNDLLQTKKDFDLDNYFRNDPASIKKLQRAVLLKNDVKYKDTFSKVKALVDNKYIDLEKFVDEYKRILNNLPFGLRTKERADREFVKWLKKAVPELAYIADLAQDPVLKKFLDSIKIGATPQDFIKELQDLFGKDIVEIVEEVNKEAPIKVTQETIEQVKVVKDAIDVASDVATQAKVIEDTAIMQTRALLRDIINDFFKTTKEYKSINDFSIIQRLDFIDKRLLNYQGKHYGFNKFNEYLAALRNSLAPDAKKDLERIYTIFAALGLDINKKNRQLINLYLDYKRVPKEGRTKILKKMQKFLLENSADDYSFSALDAVSSLETTKKVINTVKDVYANDPVVVSMKTKVSQLTDAMKVSGTEVQKRVQGVLDSHGLSTSKPFFEELDNLDPYDGGDLIWSENFTSWEASYKNLMSMSASMQDPRQFYDNLENFKANVTRLYWRLRDTKNNRTLIDLLSNTNTPSIIADLYEALEEIDSTIIPRIIDAVGQQDLYYLQLTHKANYNMLKIKLNTLFSTTNPDAWAEYKNPTSKTRANLEKVVTTLANYKGADNTMVNQFAREISEVLSYLDATTALDNLIDSIPNMSKYMTSDKINNVLIDRIFNLIEKLNYDYSVNINNLNAEDIWEELYDDFYKVFNLPGLDLMRDLIKENPEFTDSYLAFKAGNLEFLPEYYNMYMENFKPNFIDAFNKYLNNIRNIQTRTPYITIGTIIDTRAVATMNSLGGFAADIQDALQKLNIEQDSIQLTSDFITSVTGQYIQKEIDAAQVYADTVISQITEELAPKTLKEINDKITKEHLQQIRNVDNTLARAATDAWNDINRINKDLQGVFGTSGRIKSKDSVKKIKNIIGYMTRSELDNALASTNEQFNILSWAISNNIGVKKAFDAKFITVHNLYPDKFKFLAGVNDNVYVQFYNNYVNYYKYINSYIEATEEEVEFLRESLIKFVSENNTTTVWLPNNPTIYFANLDDKDILAWDQLINSGIMEERTRAGYNLVNKYRLIKAPKLESLKTDNLLNITKYCNARQKLVNGVTLTAEDWDELVKGTPIDQLNLLTDVYTSDLTRFIKSPDSMQAHKLMFESYINRNVSAYKNLDSIIDVSKDTREIGERVNFNKLSKYESEQLAKVGVRRNTVINSNEFQRYLTLERNRNMAMTIRTGDAKNLRAWIDNYTEGTLFYVSNGVPFKWTKKELAEAGVVMKRFPESDIWIFHRTDNINRGYKVNWKMGKPIFPEIQQIYTDAIAANRNYFGLFDMDVPNEVLTGQMVATKEYRAIMNAESVQKLIGDSAEQKVYSKLSKNGRNNFYYGDFNRPNLVFVGDTSNAYNTILDQFTADLIEQGVTPVFKNNRLDTSVYLGSTIAIKNIDKKTKFLQLFFNDDFSLGNPLFKHGFEQATDADIKQFFKRNNWVACLLKEDRHGNPRVYKIYIDNKKQLADAIKAKAVVVPYDIYSTMISAINDSLIEDKVLQAYTKYIVSTFKTLYLTSAGFLLRNGLDSLVYKNMNSTDGLPGMLDTFRYEYEARQLIKDYNKTITDVIKMGDGQFKISNLDEVLSKLSSDKQLEFRLTDRFMHSSASSGLAEAMEKYYRSKELREGITTGNKSLWSMINADIIHGEYSPITIVNNMNSNIEQTARYGLFLKLVHDGVDVSDAIKRVIDTHFNYDIKGTNLEVMEQLFWFSTFPINNFSYYINEGLTRNTELLKAQLDAMELSYNNDHITWEDVKRSKYLRYNASVGNIVLRFNGKNIVVKTGSSVFDFFNLLFNPLGEISERVNPFLAVILGLENVTELNPLSSAYSRSKQFFQGKSLVPSIYAPLYDKQTYTRLPRTTYSYSYNKSKWRFKPRKSYFKNPDNMRRMRYKFTTYRYYFGRGKNYRRWLQSTTSIEPYWHNENYKRLRTTRFKKYKQQIKRM